MTNGTAGDPGAEVRLRTMRILWATFLLNVGALVVIGQFARPERDAPAAGGADGVPPLLYALGGAALSSVAASFFVKASFYKRAAERQEPAQLQAGFVVAMALCEAAALVGFVGLFTTDGDYAYALFALGALGMALHFPRREQVLAPYYKSRM